MYIKNYYKLVFKVKSCLILLYVLIQAYEHVYRGWMILNANRNYMLVIEEAYTQT